MLVISQEQMEAMSAYTLGQFEERNVARLRATFPAQTGELSDDALRALIHQAIARARSYGVSDENDVECYLDCVVLYGPDFDSDPRTAWAGAVLRNPVLMGAQKMDQICHYQVFILKGQT